MSKSFKRLRYELEITNTSENHLKTIDIITSTLDSCNSFSEFRETGQKKYLKNLQKLSLNIHKDKQMLCNLNVDQIAAFNDTWNKCIARNSALTYHLQLRNNKHVIRQLKQLYTILTNKSSAKLNNVTELKRNIQARLYNAPKELRKKIYNKIEKKQLKQFLDFIDYSFHTIHALTGDLLSGIDPVVKFLLPHTLDLGGKIVGSLVGSYIDFLLLPTPLAPLAVFGFSRITGQALAGTAAKQVGKFGYKGFNKYHTKVYANTKKDKKLGDMIYNKLHKKIYKIGIEDITATYPALEKFKAKINLSIGKISEELTGLEKNPEFKKLNKKLQKSLNKMDANDPKQFMTNLSVATNTLNKLNTYLESNTSDKNLSTAVTNTNKFIESLNPTDKTRLNILKYSNRFFEASNEFKSNPKVNKMVKINILPRSTYYKIRKLELEILRVTCNINYVLVPVTKIVLPMAMGIGGYAGGMALINTLDVPTFGAAIPASFILAPLIASFTAFSGVLAASALEKTNELMKKRVAILGKELAIHQAVNVADKKKKRKAKITKPRLPLMKKIKSRLKKSK